MGSICGEASKFSVQFGTGEKWSVWPRGSQVAGQLDQEESPVEWVWTDWPAGQKRFAIRFDAGEGKVPRRVKKFCKTVDSEGCCF